MAAYGLGRATFESYWQPTVNARKTRAFEYVSTALLVATLIGAAAGWAAWRVRQRVLSMGLRAAIEKGSVEDARRLLQRGADPRTKVEYRGTVLHFATSHRDLPLMRLALERRAPVSEYCSILGHDTATDLTPLMIACSQGEPSAADLLLAHGADPNLRDSTGRSTLEMALSAGNTFGFAGSSYAAKVIRALVRHGADVRNCERQGARLVHSAIWSQPGLVVWLLGLGADAKQRDVAGRTTLMAACQQNRPSLIRPLLTAGAPLNVRDASGRTALHHALQAGAVECVRMLRGAGAVASDTLNAELIGTVTDHGSRVGSGRVLTLNSKQRLARCIALLRSGADPNADDGNRQSALMLAAARGDAPVVRLLLRHSADPNHSDGGSPLRDALGSEKNAKVLRLLVRAGARVNAVKGGSTVLIDAAESGEPANLRALIACGAKVNYQDGSGESALMRAAAFHQDGVRTSPVRRGRRCQSSRPKRSDRAAPGPRLLGGGGTVAPRDDQTPEGRRGPLRCNDAWNVQGISNGRAATQRSPTRHPSPLAGELLQKLRRVDDSQVRVGALKRRPLGAVLVHEVQEVAVPGHQITRAGRNGKIDYGLIVRVAFIREAARHLVEHHRLLLE